MRAARGSRVARLATIATPAAFAFAFAFACGRDEVAPSPPSAAAPLVDAGATDAPIERAGCGDGACGSGETCLSCAADCACPETLGVVWTPESATPVLTGRACPSFDCVGTSDPSLLRADDGALLAFVTTGGILAAGDGGFVVKGPVIARARRPDGGAFAFDPPDRGVVETAPVGAWDRHVETVSVVRDPKTSALAMFYMGYEAQPGDPNFVPGGFHYQKTAIGRMAAQDPDGTTWQRGAAPIYRPAPGSWDAVFVTGTSVVIGPDGVWRLYYSGAGTTVGVGLLTSTDGITWQPHAQNPVFERDLGAWDQATIEPSVRWFGGRYWMFYSGYREPLDETTRIAIGLATSTDGVRWERHPASPVLGPGAAGTWNDLRVLSADVMLEDDGSLLLAAYGCDARDKCENGKLSVGLWRSR